MSNDEEVRISRSVPLDQLRQPETDVRQHRPEDAVKSLAASMGDPDVGQLQDVLVHPVDQDGLDLEGTEEELDELFRDGHPMRIVDGETRRLAAEYLGWARLDATIVPAPPEDTVVAQLDANTERVEMSEYETVRALYDHYNETENTLDDVGSKVGYSASYLSNVFGLFESPDWLHDAWANPAHPLETSHALSVKSMLSENSIEMYAEAGQLGDKEAYDRAVKDARLMVDVQQEHDLQVGEFRQRCKRCRKETLDQLQDGRSQAQKQADGQRSAAESQHSSVEETKPDPCMVCGGDRPHARKFAIDVCEQDYGMLSEMKANGDVLMAQADQGETPPAPPEENSEGDVDPVQALAKATGIAPQQAQQVIAEVQQQAAQAPQQDDD